MHVTDLPVNAWTGCVSHFGVWWRTKVEICDSHCSLAKCLPAKASNRFLYYPSLSFRLLAKLKHYEAFKKANITMKNFDKNPSLEWSHKWVNEATNIHFGRFNSQLLLPEVWIFREWNKSCFIWFEKITSVCTLLTAHRLNCLVSDKVLRLKCPHKTCTFFFLRFLLLLNP